MKVVDRPKTAIKRMGPGWAARYRATLIVSDVLCALRAGGLAVVVRFGGGYSYVEPYALLSGALPVLWVVVVGWSRAYEPRFAGVKSEEFWRVARAGVMLTAAVAVGRICRPRSTSIKGLSCHRVTCRVGFDAARPDMPCGAGCTISGRNPVHASASSPWATENRWPIWYGSSRKCAHGMLLKRTVACLPDDSASGRGGQGSRAGRVLRCPAGGRPDRGRHPSRCWPAGPYIFVLSPDRPATLPTMRHSIKTSVKWGRYCIS